MAKRKQAPSAGDSDDADIASFALSDKKRVAVRRYKGMVLVDVREMYVDKATGELRPGQKGISLTTEQFLALAAHMDAIRDAVEGAEGRGASKKAKAGEGGAADGKTDGEANDAARDGEGDAT
jgi:hypothetical protein